MHPPYQQPPSQPPRQGMSTGAKVTLFGCGGCATLLVVLFVAVGCLALVGQDRWAEDQVRVALEGRDRAALGLNAPPDGLFFLRADYP